MLNFVKTFVQHEDIEDGNVRVGVVTYSTTVSIQFHLDEHKSRHDLEKAIESIPYQFGNTNTAAGLRTMHNVLFTSDHGDRPDADNIAIILTDGISNIGHTRTIPEANSAKDNGIRIYAIGIGLIDTKELDGMASLPTADHSFNVNDFSELDNLQDAVLDSTCKVITLPPTTTPLVCNAARQDIVFILDMSTSVGFSNFAKMLEFLENFLSHDDIDNGIVRVGVVGYSTDAKVEFHLNEYSSTTSLYNGINNIKYMLGNTNTAAGLKLMRTTMFTIEHGDRLDAENIAIIITDGISNVNSRQTLPEARTARNSGIKIYAIGVGLTETTELQGIASLPLEEHLLLTDDFSELNSLKDTVFESKCPKTTPTPEPTTPMPTSPAPTAPPIGSIALRY
ncbi:collagen alpha-1(XII) chain-like [Mizuhopecten yessoensis]|uniref:collagen alpha-1(XII) chain-like n=1 Tax=Mizuhopecten yessoensis TaxID=6573 RepID=UPI000B458642|nr:collagen alpha-1(XII) chain-like [Mizuhopecten yessoensis]